MWLELPNLKLSLPKEAVSPVVSCQFLLPNEVGRSGREKERKLSTEEKKVEKLEKT